MKADDICELTAAEAGFYFAFSRCQGIQKKSEQVDKPWAINSISAAPLAEIIDEEQRHGAGHSSKEGDEVPESVREELVAARFDRWWRRRGASRAATPKTEAPVDKALAALSEARSNEPGQALRQWHHRRVIGRAIESSGGDLSPVGRRHFDLRRFLAEVGEESLFDHFAVVGALVVASLNQGSLRRRLAAHLRVLPTQVAEQVRQRLGQIQELAPPVERRIYEITRQIAAHAEGPYNEYGLVGACLVVSAAQFRQGPLVCCLRARLAGPKAQWIQFFQRSCLQSGKADIFPLLAAAVQDHLWPPKTAAPEATNQREDDHE